MTAPSIADTVTLVSPSVIAVVTESATGSGVVIDAGVLTNEHVVHGATSIVVVTQDGRRFPAAVVRSDAVTDLAVLRTDADLPSVPMEPARAQRQGDELLVLGYPLGVGIGGQPTLTRGLLSAIRTINGVTFIQTDATINHGNSGGPLFTLSGKLVGLATFARRDPQGGVGLNFAIATEAIQTFLAGGSAAQEPAQDSPGQPSPPAASATQPVSTQTPLPTATPQPTPQPTATPTPQPDQLPLRASGSGTPPQNPFGLPTNPVYLAGGRYKAAWSASIMPGFRDCVYYAGLREVTDQTGSDETLAFATDIQFEYGKKRTATGESQFVAPPGRYVVDNGSHNCTWTIEIVRVGDY